MLNRMLGTILVAVCVVSVPAYGEYPSQLHHQGVVAVHGERFTGDGDFQFALVDPNTGIYLWVNDGSAPNPPTDAVTLVVVNGIYSVRLGDTALPNMTAIPRAVFNEHENVVLRIWFDDAVNGIHQLTPDQPLTSVPYAQRLPNVVVDELTGNVGIGTTSPSAALDVNGAVRGTTVEITGGSPIEQPLESWGLNEYGQTDVPAGTFSAVAAGREHSLAIRTDDRLVGWGNNAAGQVDPQEGTFTAVAGGAAYSLAIRTDGTLVGWGNNYEGQTDVPAGTFTAVAAGAIHGLAIRTDGTLVGWGNNDFGQVDPQEGTFTTVAGGYRFSLAIRTDGTLLGWGQNNYGQTDVPQGTFTAIAAGSDHSLAIDSDGNLFAWGRDHYAQVSGKPTTGTFTAVAAGAAHSLAMRTDGTLVAWGHNEHGQGDVPKGIMFTAVAAGQFHTLAIRADTMNTPALRLHTDSAVKPGSHHWTVLSDRRLKRNIQGISGALERLLQLHGVHFEWIDPALQGGRYGSQMGLLADEVEGVFPAWVGRDSSGYKTLTIGGFEALATEALRELREEKNMEMAAQNEEIATQNEEIAAQNEEIAAQKEEIEDLRRRFKQLEAGQPGRAGQ
jgi:hypothetical protein